NRGWYPAERGLVNRFFRSALFPLVIIAALVWLALQTLGGHSSKTEKYTYSQVYNQVLQCPTENQAGSCSIQEVVFNPNKQQLNVKYNRGKKATGHYPSDQVVPDLQKQVHDHNVLYDSK